MWFSKKHPEIRLGNTLTGEKEVFSPLRGSSVSLYSCGPTVYGPAHIGNLRSYVFADTLARMLTEAKYRVKRVINITDVGHLVGDGDEGEDKMKVGAERDHTTPEAIADRYTAKFKEDIAALNIDTDTISFPKATAYLKEQIAMIKNLEKKGFTYVTSDGVYFDTATFPGYGALGNVRNAKLEAGARVAIGEKKNTHDFALWRNAKPHDLQKWPSPWGEGNPGWSIECSAMAISLLGERIDLHTGGEDHIQVHHNNEIAQSECATGKHPFVKVWMHNAFMSINGEKISKSLGNTYTLDDLTARGIDPLALRYFFLQAHYKTPLSFSFESLAAAQEALMRLRTLARTILADAHGKAIPASPQDRFARFMQDDLGTPAALAYLWEAVKDTALSPGDKLGLLTTADAYFGLSLFKEEEELPVPPDVEALVKKREEARQKKDFATSDELRIHIKERGYHVEDSPSGPILSKIVR
jgi:cysteinyl-tRNA synthetase